MLSPLELQDFEFNKQIEFFLNVSIQKDAAVLQSHLNVEMGKEDRRIEYYYF